MTIRTTYEAASWFFGAMLEKLRQNEHKGDDWHEDHPLELLDRVQDELIEALEAVRRGEAPARVLDECADIANMAMMAADSYRVNEFPEEESDDEA